MNTSTHTQTHIENAKRALVDALGSPATTLTIASATEIGHRIIHALAVLNDDVTVKQTSITVVVKGAITVVVNGAQDERTPQKESSSHA